jgi:hypothetical protein
MRGADLRDQRGVCLSTLRRLPLRPRVIAAGGDTQQPAHGGDREGDALRRHRGAFGPAVFIHQRDNACARRRTAAVRRLPQHNATDVLAGYPPDCV